ncbi:MAG: CBS domain-containing protein [Rhodospirillales bacterium]|nr:CBS domain-containing protein [Rhodospirillales bacterium]MBO6785273.1 CBS domain-containing protein [Rhodospirillales bacterium]
MSFHAPKGGLSGLPLSAVPAIVADTETTGLDTANDRVIEIAAVRVVHGEVLDDRFEELIDPGLPIPPKSTEIHGIRDDDVAGKAPFSDVMSRFVQWAQNDVMIGYSLGFDLGILEAEHTRNKVQWCAPRSLDVRHLMQVVAPDLPGQSLEITAEWLGIEITDRHRALGDAMVTAQIFNALIDKLREKDIVTLAQAERACRNLTSHRNAEAQAGWHEVAGPSRSDDALLLARIDSYPYRHRVAEVMASPPITLDGATSMRDALRTLIDRKISSVFVEPGGTGEWGIMTERDVLRAIAGDGPGALDAALDKYAIRPLVSIPAEEFIYRAITRMSGRDFRHLGVTDSAGNVIGALSARDLLKQRAGDAMSLGDTIEAATTPAELGRIWESLTMVAGSLSSEGVDPRNIAAIISHELCAMTRRATELAELQMLDEGRGPAPEPYAMLVLGSGGRGESLLAMDQDNAIVFEAGEPDSEADKWFQRLGEIAADTLDGVGVSYCNGGIMAKNPEWRKDIKNWRATVQQWISKAKPEDILNSDIFFDARPVLGDKPLGDALRREAMEMAQGSKIFLQHMAVRAADFDSALGWFGRPKTDNGRIDLKKFGIMPIFSAARVLALQLGIDERSTPGRLLAAREHDIHGAHLIGNLVDAHRILLNAILRQQLRDIEDGVKLSNKVELAQLDNHEKQELTWALQQSPGISDLMGTPTRF